VGRRGSIRTLSQGLTTRRSPQLARQHQRRGRIIGAVLLAVVAAFILIVSGLPRLT
jgi:hypothetical protein